jgi:hypothetical protein
LPDLRSYNVLRLCHAPETELDGITRPGLYCSNNGAYCNVPQLLN